MEKLRTLTTVVALGTAALLSNSARADQIILDNGDVIEGSAHEEGDHVVVSLDMGSLTLPKNEIREIKKGDTPLDALQKMKQNVKGDNVADLQRVAAWAKDQGLDSKAREMYRRVLEIAPNDAKAHQALGDRQLDGRWLSEDDYMIAKGYVLYEGTWRTRDEVRALEAEDSARHERLASQQKIAELENEMARMRGEEEAYARDQAEYDRLYQNNYGWGWGWWPWWGWPVGRFGRLDRFHRFDRFGRPLHSFASRGLVNRPHFGVPSALNRPGGGGFGMRGFSGRSVAGHGGFGGHGGGGHGGGRGR
jgi:hypothetical protein